MYSLYLFVLCRDKIRFTQALKQAGPDGERLRLKSAKLYDEALKYCINCKRCEVACPSDVKIETLLYEQETNTLTNSISS